MRHSLFPNACKVIVLVAAIGVGIALPATAAENFSPVPQTDAFTDSYARSCPRFCPQFLAKYCVLTRSGHREAVWTNGCFACQRGWRILHAGACRR
jgi:hypothetical protein